MPTKITLDSLAIILAVFVFGPLGLAIALWVLVDLWREVRTQTKVRRTLAERERWLADVRERRAAKGWEEV